MRFSVARLAIVAAAALPLAHSAPTPATANLKIRNPHATDVVENSYIVVYKEGVSAEEISVHESSISFGLRRRDAPYTGIGAKYSMTAFAGYQIQADATTIEEIAAANEV